MTAIELFNTSSAENGIVIVPAIPGHAIIPIQACFFVVGCEAAATCVLAHIDATADIAIAQEVGQSLELLSSAFFEWQVSHGTMQLRPEADLVLYASDLNPPGPYAGDGEIVVSVWYSVIKLP